MYASIYLFNVGGGFLSTERPWSQTGTYDGQIGTARYLAKPQDKQVFFMAHVTRHSVRDHVPGGSQHWDNYRTQGIAALVNSHKLRRVKKSRTKNPRQLCYHDHSSNHQCARGLYKKGLPTPIRVQMVE